jgi:lipoprotein-anchoring transpeptidase ErfK/SrfK
MHALRNAFVPAAAAGLLLSGCASAAAPNLAAPSLRPRAIPVAVAWSAPDHASLAPGSTVTVSADGGKLAGLTVTSSAGTAVQVHGGVTAALPPGATYTMTARLTASDGSHPLVATRTVRTQPAARQLTAQISPAAGATIGVGEPIVITLNWPAVNHAAVERALSVTTSRPVGPAGWYWFSDTRLEYRPSVYWPAHTTVTVRATLVGVRTGQVTWGARDASSTYTVGRSQILRIDDATHLMTVIRDGSAIRTVPVSLGQHQGSWITHSGIKTIMSIERTVRMNSATVGITGAGAYDESVPFAMRITNSGEYVHGAPWSEWAQGHTDVSHGCTNVSLANGEWLYDNSLVGDVVETTGTGRPMEADNGTGGAWDIPWAVWAARRPASG